MVDFVYDTAEFVLDYAGPGTGVKSTIVYAAKSGKSIVSAVKSGVSKGWNKIKGWRGKTDEVVPDVVPVPNFSNYATLATKNSNSMEVVLGKYNVDLNAVSYDRVAQARGATFFHLENWDDVSRKIGAEKMWNINEAFLSQQVSLGKSFVLTHDPKAATGYFLDEIKFLRNKGYDFVQNGSVWTSVKN